MTILRLIEYNGTDYFELVLVTASAFLLVLREKSVPSEKSIRTSDETVAPHRGNYASLIAAIIAAAVVSSGETAESLLLPNLDAMNSGI